LSAFNRALRDALLHRHPYQEETTMNPYPLVGTKVWIHAMGSYYAGEVVKITTKRATVRYTSGKGVVREKSVPYWPEKQRYHDKYAEQFPLVLQIEGIGAPHGARQLGARHG
jgi:hypothetical protein